MSNVSQESQHSEEIRQIWAMFKETDRKFQETDRKFQETDRKFQETDREIRKLFKETDREIRRLSVEIGNLTGKWGRFVEGMVVPGMIAMFGERGIEIERLAQRVRVRRQGEETEIDILGISGEYAVPVEVKSTLGPDDVREFLQKLEKFRQFFPEYADRKIIAAVAGIVIEGGADKFAYRQGLFVIAQKGESVKIVNDSKFRPKQF